MSASVGARPARTASTTAPPDAVVQRLAAAIGHGAAGAALAQTLAAEGVRTRADLRRPAVLRRLPRESQANVLYSPRRGVPLAEARQVAEEVRRRATFVLADGLRLRPAVVPVGSVRRGAPRSKDLDFVVVLPAGYEDRLEEVLDAFTLREVPRSAVTLSVAVTYTAGARRRSFILRRSEASPRGRGRRRCYRADLFLATEAEEPFALFHHTGSAAYNIRTRAYAKRKGWLLNQYGLFDARTGHRVRGAGAIRDERDLARFLGVTFRPPADRHSAARVDRAPPTSTRRES